MEACIPCAGGVKGFCDTCHKRMSLRVQRVGAAGAAQAKGRCRAYSRTNPLQAPAEGARSRGGKYEIG